MIAIVCDSTVYMTQEEAESLGVKIVPVGYYTPGMTYDETYIEKNGDFERLIAGNNCKTNHTNISVFLSAFNELLRQGHEILCLTISSRLSGTYSSASIAAKETGSDKIIVVDSLTTAGGLFMMVKKARELINNNKTLIETAFALEEMRNKISIIFSVNDMTPLRRSGRLGIIRQSVGTVLNMRPILMCAEGSVISNGTARGSTEQTEQMINPIPLDCEEVYIHYINNYKMTARLTKALQDRNFTGKITLRKLGPVLGIHLGLSVTGVVWFKKS